MPALVGYPAFVDWGILRYWPYSRSWFLMSLNWLACEVIEKDGVDLISSIPFTLNGAWLWLRCPTEFLWCLAAPL